MGKNFEGKAVGESMGKFGRRIEFEPRDERSEWEKLNAKLSTENAELREELARLKAENRGLKRREEHCLRHHSVRTTS